MFSFSGKKGEITRKMKATGCCVMTSTGRKVTVDGDKMIIIVIVMNIMLVTVIIF